MNYYLINLQDLKHIVEQFFRPPFSVNVVLHYILTKRIKQLGSINNTPIAHSHYYKVITVLLLLSF